MPSWTCTSEPAVKSNAADFESGDVAFGQIESGIEAVGTEFIDAGSRGWEGIEGEYAAGLQFVSTVVGKQVVELSRRAFALKSWHGRAAEALGPLQTASDSLLIDAEEALARHTAAQAAYESLQSSAMYWLGQRNREVGDSPEWHGANATYGLVSRMAGDQARARDAAADELDAFQVTFTTLREDEEAAHQSFADSVNAVNLETTLVDVDPGGSVAVSVDKLLDLLDAAMLTMSGDPRAVTSRAQLNRWRDARAAIAGMADVDLDEHDRRIGDVRLLRDFRNSTADDVGSQISQALRDGNRTESARLARMLVLGIADLDVDGGGGGAGGLFLADLSQYLVTYGSGWPHLMTLFAVSEGPLPTWMVDAIIGFERQYDGMFVDVVATRYMLAEVLELDSNDPNDPMLRDLGLNQEVLVSLFGRVLETPYGREQLLAVRDGDSDRLEGPYAGRAAYEYMLEHPAVFGDLTKELAPDLPRVQRLLDLASEGTTSQEMDLLFDRLVVHLLETEQYPPDVDLTRRPDIGMSQFADEVGGLLYQFGRAGEVDSYNPAGIMRFLAETAAGTIPHGSTAIKFIEGGEAYFDGYQESDLYDQLTANGDRVFDETLIAVGVVIAAGGPIAEQLAGLAASAGDPVSLYTQLQENDPLARYIDEVRQEVNGGIREAQRPRVDN